MNSIKSMRLICNNIFIFAPLFVEFYAATSEKEKNILLSYLILPLTLYPPSRRALKNSKANTTSSLYSVFTERKKEDRIFGIEERIANYKIITNKTIQYALSSKMLSINEDLSISAINTANGCKKLCPKDTLMAARKLGILLAKYEIPTCYGILGVKHI